MSEPRVVPGSRYAGIEQATYLRPDGSMVPYLKRRFLPREPGPALTSHVVEAGERPDTIAARHLADPEQYWRICDANVVLHPRELIAEIGRRLRIPLPGGGGG